MAYFSGSQAQISSQVIAASAQELRMFRSKFEHINAESTYYCIICASGGIYNIFNACVIRCVFRLVVLSLYVIGTVLKFLFYVKVRNGPTAAVTFNYLKRYQ